MREFYRSERVSYFASQNGKIYSKSNKTGKIRMLSLSVSKTGKWDRQGYLQFGIKINGKNKTFRVHRVVSDLYLKKDINEENLEVNHIDGNKHNNKVENLEWITRKNNCIHARNMGLIKSPDVSKEKNPNFGRTKHNISLIRAGIYLIKKGRSLRYASIRTGISYKLMSYYWCNRGDFWSRI